MTTPPTSARRGTWLARWARPLLAVYALLLALALLAPTSTVQSGMVFDLIKVLDVVLPSSWLTFTRAEVLMNAVIVAPVSFLGVWAFPRVRWQDWTAFGFLTSSVVEVVQGLLLPDRQPSFSDIVANTAGALLGGVVARTVLLRPRAATARETAGPSDS